MQHDNLFPTQVLGRQSLNLVALEEGKAVDHLNLLSTLKTLFAVLEGGSELHARKQITECSRSQAMWSKRMNRQLGPVYYL